MFSNTRKSNRSVGWVVVGVGLKSGNDGMIIDMYDFRNDVADDLKKLP